MKKQLILVVMIMLCISYSLAFDVKTTFETKAYVFEDPQPLNFSIKLTNAEAGYYSVYTLADLYITPTGTTYINSNEGTIHLSITPYERFNKEGDFSFIYTIYRKNGERRDLIETLEFYYLNSALKIETNDINFEDDKIKLYVKNLIDHDFENLTAEFSSILFNVNKTFNLKAEETKEFEIEIDPEVLKKTKAGTYVIEAIFYFEDETSEVNGKLYLNETKDTTTNEDESGFLIRRTSITKINTGNSVERVNVEITKNIFNRFFTSFNVRPHEITREGSKIIYSWNQRIEPAEIFNVTAKTNYLSPVIVILLIILAARYLKRLFQQKLVVKKSVTPIKTKNAEFALKVKLVLKSRKDIQDIKLTDKIPRTVKLFKKFSSIEPDKIDIERRQLSWNIDEMKAGEERTFTYIIYSRVGFVGKFSLPKAEAKFVVEEKLLREESNSVYFMNEQSTKD